MTWNRFEETSLEMAFWRNLRDFTSLPMKVTENDAYFVFICRLCIDSASSYYVVSNTNHKTILFIQPEFQINNNRMVERTNRIFKGI